MVVMKNISGYANFLKAIEEFATVSQLNIYFIGNKDEKGQSWCPDCNNAEPHVMNALTEYAAQESIFLIVNVGNRSFWKDLVNPFRTDKNVQLSVIPTLLRWKSPMRLDGDQCAKMDLLEMFFKEGNEK